MRRRLLPVAILLTLALAASGCAPPSDGSPGSAGVPVMGQSRLTGAQLAAWYRANAPASLPYRAWWVTLDDLANLYVSEGNRYNVRGDIAFAQSVLETAWFNFPDYGQVKPWNNNFSGIGACDSCNNGFQFSSPTAGVRAQIQLLRNYADAGSSTANIPDPPVPELWGSNWLVAAYNFDHYFAKGRAPLWNDMGNGNWASAPNYATAVLRLYNQMLTFNGQSGQCPADGLTFGGLTGLGPCPVSIRQPGRAIAPNGNGYYVLSGDGTVNAYRGAPYFGSQIFDSDLGRDIAVMPDGQGYVVLDAWGRVFKFGSATRPDTVGSLDSRGTFPDDGARSIALMPDGKGYIELMSDGTLAKFGSAAEGAIGALPGPTFSGDLARSIQITHDGAGYVVLDDSGTVSKYGSATTGPLGAATTPVYPGMRDIVLVWWMTDLGYYLIDASGNVLTGGAIPPLKNPSPTAWFDRWRGLALFGGPSLLLLKNDGATTASVPGP